MPAWEVRTISAQPGITLVRWRVFETELKERHFAGYCPETHKGRVSSAVQSFDPTTRLAVTRSGRVYELVGPPSQDLDALYVWGVWSGKNNVESYTDVTARIDASVTPGIGRVSSRGPDGDAGCAQLSA